MKLVRISVEDDSRFSGPGSILLRTDWNNDYHTAYRFKVQTVLQDVDTGEHVIAMLHNIIAAIKNGDRT